MHTYNRLSIADTKSPLTKNKGVNCINNVHAAPRIQSSTEQVHRPMQIYTINSANQSAYWNGQKWVITSVSEYNPVAMTFDLAGNQWLIDHLGHVMTVNQQQNQVESKGKLGNWAIKELHFASNGDKYCVSRDHKIGWWAREAKNWEDISYGIKAKSISFSPSGQLWCLDNDYRVSQWNSRTNEWSKRTLLGGRMLIQIAFYNENELYCVTEDHEISVRNLANDQWQNLGALSRWGVKYVTFKRPISIDLQK